MLTLLSLLLVPPGAVTAPVPAAPRYIIYLHARVVEDQGRLPIDSTFGVYQYDAILDSLRHAGFTVLSDQRPPKANSDSFAARVVRQVDSLLRLGVPPSAISVVGFSKGGWIAILASARLQNPAVNFVFMGACGPWSNDRADLHVAGRLLSLYETSDSLGVSCAPMLARRSPGSVAEEIALSAGLGHGTFFQPRAAWLAPVTAWAAGRPADLLGAAASVYEAYGQALIQGRRDRLASFYDTDDVLRILNGTPSRESRATLDARYRGQWRPPAYFRWDTLAFRPVGARHVLVTGGFRWQSAGQADTAHYQYTALLLAVDSTLVITFEQETAWPSP